MALASSHPLGSSRPQTPDFPLLGLTPLPAPEGAACSGPAQQSTPPCWPQGLAQGQVRDPAYIVRLSSRTFENGASPTFH